MFVRQHWPAFSTYFQTIYFRLYIIKSFVKLMKPKLVMSYRIVTPQFQGKHIPECTGCSIAHSHGEGGGWVLIVTAHTMLTLVVGFMLFICYCQITNH